MSTQLLTVGEKVHELSDDLESHFFVLLFEGLHFVQHNKPWGISMNLFDEVYVNPETGNHTGGIAKSVFYSCGYGRVNRQLEFTSKPFTTLIRGLYRLFGNLELCHIAKLNEVAPASDSEGEVEKLKGGVGVAALFDEALRSKEWPTECDKVLDQYPPIIRSDPERRDTVQLSHFNESPVPEPPNGKRKRETEGKVRRSRRIRDKRTKVDPPR